jgi:hypothetical protein
MDPLDVNVLAPVIIAIEPPDCASVDSPALITRSPPVPVLPLPTTRLTIPLLPICATPDEIERRPLLPAVDAPLPSVIPPLTPTTPASFVPRDALPLDVSVLYPLVTDITPPED